MGTLSWPNVIAFMFREGQSQGERHITLKAEIIVTHLEDGERSHKPL